MSDALRTGTIRARKPLPIRRKFQILPLGTFSNEILMYFRTSRDVLALFQKLSYDSSIRHRKLPLPRWSLTGRQGSLFLPNETKPRKSGDDHATDPLI